MSTTETELKAKLLAIHDLSAARLEGANVSADPSIWQHDMREIERLSRAAAARPAHYPPGMGDESRRLHREYNALVRAQNGGAQNGPEVVRLTDECNAKGIILVPGGEHL